MKNLELCIVVGRDATVGGVKGKKPQQNERERMAAMKALFPECRVVLGHTTNRLYWLRKVRPAVVFLGYDQEAFVDILKSEIAHQKKILRLKPFNEATYKSSKIKTPHVILRGEVVHGKKMGRAIGYPTANIRLSAGMKRWVEQKKLYGIYASRVLLATPTGIRTYLGATVIGARAHGGAPLVETHLIGYKGDCYGATMILSLEKKLREFKVYSSDEQLKKDIARDIVRVQEFFRH